MTLKELDAIEERIDTFHPGARDTIRRLVEALRRCIKESA